MQQSDIGYKDVGNCDEAALGERWLVSKISCTRTATPVSAPIEQQDGYSAVYIIHIILLLEHAISQQF